MTGGLTPDAKPWLTVITPVYRGERWIEQSLQSLADQCNGGVELIVIDSSPDDATAVAPVPAGEAAPARKKGPVRIRRQDA